MPDAGPTGAAARPSVFISYASDDRSAARQLRDALIAAGLDVWYDENELGGGDAWDQKIRKQIRDCDYFMPVISAATERRKEGYFRREWRIATERTMDMADDVLFLLPVVLDDTTETNARVPERFLTVQWLRTPGGQFTPALAALTQRLLAGEHTNAPRPPLIVRPSAGKTSLPPEAAAPVKSGPPPMPPFPHHAPNTGHWTKYCAEVFWWMLTVVWLLFGRLPRFLRIIFAVWIVLSLLGPCSWKSKKPERTATKDAAGAPASGGKEVKDAPDFGRLGVEIAQRFGGIAAAAASALGKPLLVVPFKTEGADAATAKFVDATFDACYGQLTRQRPEAVALSPLPPDAEEPAAIGRDFKAGFVLSARVVKNPDGASSLSVNLIRGSDGASAWTRDFPIASSDAAQAGAQIAEAALAALPAR